MLKIKKIIAVLIMFGISVCSLGCTLKKSTLESATIYTTIYPTEYIVKYLYGDNNQIESIYTEGVDIDNFSLTEKQIENYAKGDIFVYIGLGNELEIAKSFINKNKNLLLIDSSFGLSYKNNIRELWLAPNNFLMLTKNIRNSLIENIDNTLKKEEINKKFDEIYAKVSMIDAELRNIAKEAKESGNNTIVSSSNTFKFLNGYGFNVVSIEDIENSKSENAINDLKNKFKNGKYTTIIKLKNEKNSNLTNELIEKSQTKVVEINDLITNKDSASDYVSIQYENIALIRNIFTK